jgi:hypothetical protein
VVKNDEGNRIYNWQSKATNYALRADMNEAEFIQEVTDGLLPPAYFECGDE